MSNDGAREPCRREMRPTVVLRPRTPQRGRDADRAAGVGAGGERHEAGGDGGGRATARPAGTRFRSHGFRVEPRAGFWVVMLPAELVRRVEPTMTVRPPAAGPRPCCRAAPDGRPGPPTRSCPGHRRRTAPSPRSAGPTAPRSPRRDRRRRPARRSRRDRPGRLGEHLGEAPSSASKRSMRSRSSAAATAPTRACRSLRRTPRRGRRQPRDATSGRGRGWAAVPRRTAG